MHENRYPVSRFAMWAFWLYTLVLIAFGAAVLVLGAVLIAEGGWWYSALVGLAVVVAGLLLALRRGSGVLIFGLASLFTVAWALWEVGLDGWSLIPRLAWLAGFGLLLLA